MKTHASARAPIPATCSGGAFLDAGTGVMLVALRCAPGYTRIWTPLLAVLLLLASGCETTGGPRSEEAAAATASTGTASSAGTFPSLTLETASGQSLGDVIRSIGEQVGGGAVLLSGMEEWSAPEVTLSGAGYADGMRKLLASHESRIQVTPHYVFLYPQGYEQLESLSLQGRVHGRFDTMSASYAIGAGTYLYNALALLSASLETTIVADNIVAESWCGELFLEEAPVRVILEALLKSARIPGNAIEVDSTESYVFLRSAQNRNRGQACVNPGEITPAQRQQLDSVVQVRLPREASGTMFEAGAANLAEALPEFARQAGIPITAETDLAQLPVYVSVFNGVSLETALNLVVWQWPVAEFGYKVTDAGIVFCRR